MIYVIQHIPIILIAIVRMEFFLFILPFITED